MKKAAALILIAIMLLMYGCSQNESAQGGNSLADEKAESILDGLNKADYTMFSSDFAGNIKQSMDEEYFSRLSSFVKENSGGYISKALAFSKEEQGLKVFGYDCQFSKESVLMTVSFSADLSKVEGLYFDSENMREALGQQIAGLQQP